MEFKTFNKIHYDRENFIVWLFGSNIVWRKNFAFVLFPE